MLYQEFDAYLTGDMNPDQVKELESRLEQDKVLQEQFEIYQFAVRNLENTYDPKTAAFKANLEAISKAHFAQNTQKGKLITLNRWMVSIAASVVLVFGLWYFLSDQAPQYSDFDDHEQAAFVERGNAEVMLKEAQEAFNTKHYKDAVAFFEKIPTTSRTTEVTYFYAISLLETNQFSDAEKLLQSIVNLDVMYKDKALWYLALLQLKQHHLESCREYLYQIATDSEVSEKAQTLLQELE